METKLLEGIASGDELAFRQLFRLYGDRLYRFACGLLNNEQEAEEVVQDVFLQLWLRRGQILQIQHFSTYCYTSVRNTALNYLKKRNARPPMDEPEALDACIDHSVSGSDDLLITKENLHAIGKAVEALPPSCRTIFRLVREDGLKYREVAEIMGITLSTVSVQMGIATRKICARISAGEHIDL